MSSSTFQALLSALDVADKFTAAFSGLPEGPSTDRNLEYPMSPQKSPLDCLTSCDLGLCLDARQAPDDLLELGTPRLRR